MICHLSNYFNSLQRKLAKMLALNLKAVFLRNSTQKMRLMVCRKSCEICNVFFQELPIRCIFCSLARVCLLMWTNRAMTSRTPIATLMTSAMTFPCRNNNIRLSKFNLWRDRRKKHLRLSRLSGKPTHAHPYPSTRRHFISFCMIFAVVTFKKRHVLVFVDQIFTESTFFSKVWHFQFF